MDVVEQVLTGSLLGDGSVYIPKRNALFTEEHSIKQLEYLKWKAGIISPRFGGQVVVNKNNGYKVAHFYTCAYPLLTELRRLWYPNGKKVLPESELQKLGALGLAVWYQDDGCYSYQGRHCKIAIYGFKGQEFVIQKWFKERRGLNVNIHNTKKGPDLYFPVKETDKFLRSIAEHIHTSMIYKLGHLHPANQAKIEESKRKRREYQLKNPEILRRANHRYYQRHREERLKQHREYLHKRRQKNLNKVQQYNPSEVLP